MAASVQSMCDFWKKFDLQELQKELDSTATELANRQDESDASRKKLVELSREFKKNTPEDIRKIVAPLLKSFQGEIDALSKRSKAAEASFLSVYKKLIDLPDPVSVLEYAQQIQKKAHRVGDLEIENKQLRETLDEYNHEFAEVKNQEVTIKQLRERLKEGEDKVEAVAEARTKEKERELQKQFAEKERQLQETQLSVARKLGEAEQRVTSLTNTLEHVQSELFEVKAKYDEATSAKADEMEMVMADLERANERATAAEREAEKLKHQLSNLTASLADNQGGEQQKGPDMEQAIEILQRSNLEAELAAKEKEISQLVEDVQRLQGSLQKLRENTTQQVGRLEEELASKNKAFRILEEKLKTQEDYEEIKRELGVLKSIEFSSSGTDEVDGDVGKTKSLEILLLEKNKTLQTENTQLKVNSNDLSGNSSPALSSNAKEFASMLGEEIAETYQQKIAESSSSKTGLSSSPSFSAVSPKKDHEEKSMSPESGDIPPQVPSSPLSDSSRSGRPPSNETVRIPPQSPHFFHPAFSNSHLMANFMGLGMNFNNNNPPKVDVNGCQGLDTAMVAKTVRELLSIHNIGQRLFAKHVLGLSQGTVSELLSKPKSWDKLTEKGRESYRKMHSWAVDDRNIMALKAISPKKDAYLKNKVASYIEPDFYERSSQPLLPSIQREDAATEERIAHILNEAQLAMQQKKNLEQVWSKEHQNAMVSSIYQEMARSYGQLQGSQSMPLMSPTSPMPSILSSVNDRERYRKLSDSDRHRDKHNPEMSSKDMVERIYRQELIKLAQAAENAGNIAASALYQQELARLAQNARMRDEPEPGEVRHIRGSPERMKVKSEPPDSTSEDILANQGNGPIDLSKRNTSTPSTPTSGGSDKSLNSSAHAGSAFFQMHAKINGHEVTEKSLKSESHPPTSPAPHTAFPHHFSPSDTSSSPLQRMQNIANSLMNRSQIGAPCSKPLKAVLPPITQEEFDSYANINTEDLVKQVKETLSQYSISQRLFGESVLGLSQGSVSDLLARPKPWHMLTQKGREPFIRMQLFLEDAEAIPKLVASQYHIAPDKLMRSNSMSKETVSQTEMKPTPPPPPPPPPLPPPSTRPQNVPPLMLPSVAPPVSHGEPQHPLFMHHHHHHQAPPHHQLHHPNWASFSYPSSMLEVVAMTSEIDTLELTGRVKDVLQFNNLGQKLFGEAVLGLSQGSVSELLSKPKPWHMLSIKGREPFIKMHLWLSDPHNVERLKHYQNEMKANRRRRHSLEDRYDASIALPKRPRVFFSEEQKERLRQAYNRDPYPNQNTIEALANTLGVGVKTVINWFHNHRMRAKQQQHATSPTTPYSEYSQQSINKEESNDDNSNNSDISSMSDNREALNALSFHSRFINSDSNQWMFPRFEPAGLNKRSSNGSEHNMDDGSDLDDDNDDEKMDEASSPNSAKGNTQNAKDYDNGRDDDLDNDSGDDVDDGDDEIEGDENSNTDQSFDKNDKDSEYTKGQVQNMSQAGGANKRKRSHPQYVSAGRHLDRTINRIENLQKGIALTNDVSETEKENTSENIVDNRNDNSLNDLEMNDSESAKVVVRENGEDLWEKGDKSSNINKIQKSISQHSGEDWEF
ncbi:homeobox protein cut-like 1 isoform X3 [Ruditapes philippinarum]|uniref:homeobox protein cut-like 1 isoform X3 n=1 Tax=Ruditapes philippinarum TaxID=129788 RepID=UPI00295B9C5F|nr:homeobox protein cut-like 1 isoform X3 [Ruditapes philippinarum]